MTSSVRHQAGRSGVIATAAILAVACVVLLAGRDAAAGSTATASGSKTVRMAHLKFSPTPLHVAKGTTVVFTNNSKLKHTATRSGSFDTGTIKPGHSVSVRFGAVGTYSYICKIHPE